MTTNFDPFQDRPTNDTDRQAVVRAQIESGQTIMEWCFGKPYSIQSFHNWKSKWKAQESPTFLEVVNVEDRIKQLMSLRQQLRALEKSQKDILDSLPVEVSKALENLPHS